MCVYWNREVGATAQEGLDSKAGATAEAAAADGVSGPGV